MNKTLKAQFVILIIFITCGICNAQQAWILFKDGREVETNIKATSDRLIFTDHGNYFYEDVFSIHFTEKLQKHQHTYDQISQNKVEVKFLGINGKYIATPIRIQQTDFIQDFDKYTKQSEAGKSLMLVGMAAQGVALFLNAKYAKENQGVTNVDDYKYVPNALPIAGMIVFAIGITIDSDALKHLRIKKP